MSWYWSSKPSWWTNICVWDLKHLQPFMSSRDNLGAASSLVLPLILTFIFDGGKVALKSLSTPYSRSSGLRSNATAMGHVVSILVPDLHGQISAVTQSQTLTLVFPNCSPKVSHIHEITSPLPKVGTSGCWFNWPAICYSCKSMSPWHGNNMEGNDNLVLTFETFIEDSVGLTETYLISLFWKSCLV